MKHARTPSDLAESFVFRLYDLGWQLALPTLRLNSRLRAGFKDRTVQHDPVPADLWVQAASAGESYLAEGLMKKLPLKGSLRVMMTSGTKEGLEILQQGIDKAAAKGGNANISASYFPFDRPTIMERAVRGMRPKVTVLLESEIWPGLFAALKRQGSKILIINGRMTRKSLTRYLLWPSLWHGLRPDRVLAVSRPDAERFAALFGRDRVEVMGNMKFDRMGTALPWSSEDNPLRKILSPDAAFVVLGSVRKEEERLVKRIIAHVLEKEPKAIVGLFPRHLHRIRPWEKALDSLRLSWILRSQVESRVAEGTVILWDVFAELANAYGLAKAAFVGGSLAPLGGQNFLEALLCGVVPVIGPSWDNFAWVGQEILDLGLVRRVTGWPEVARVLVTDLRGAKSREWVRQSALEYVKEHQGGTQKACQLIMEALDQIYEEDHRR